MGTFYCTSMSTSMGPWKPGMHAKPPLEGVEADLAMGPRELHLHPPHTPWGRGYSTCDVVHGLQVDVEGRRAVL